MRLLLSQSVWNRKVRTRAWWVFCVCAKWRQSRHAATLQSHWLSKYWHNRFRLRRRSHNRGTEWETRLFDDANIRACFLYVRVCVLCFSMNPNRVPPVVLHQLGGVEPPDDEPRRRRRRAGNVPVMRVVFFSNCAVYLCVRFERVMNRERKRDTHMTRVRLYEYYLSKNSCALCACYCWLSDLNASRWIGEKKN